MLSQKRIVRIKRDVLPVMPTQDESGSYEYDDAGESYEYEYTDYGAATDVVNSMEGTRSRVSNV